jgi:plasmid replication initiation protein
MEEKSLTIVKSNKLIEASYRLSIGEQRLLLACISQINSHAELKKKQEFSVSAKEFSVIFDLHVNNCYAQIEKASQDLFKREVTMRTGPKRKLVTRWVSDVEYDEEHGVVTLNFAPKIIPYLSQIQNNFTKYNLEHIAKLKSVHTIRIYEMCKQYYSIGSRTVEVEKLKEIIGAEGLYPNFKDFNKRVLKTAVEEIKTHSDIVIKITPIRQMRKIVSLKFVIKKKLFDNEKPTKPNKPKVSKTKESPIQVQKGLKSIMDFLDEQITEEVSKTSKKADLGPQDMVLGPTRGPDSTLAEKAVTARTSTPTFTISV